MSETASPVVEVTGVVKEYDETVALRGVNMTLQRGTVLGLLGPNGAGKSTLVKSLCGLVLPTRGTLRVAGHPAGSFAARNAIGYLAELFRFPPWLTVREVIEFHQRLAKSDGGIAEQNTLLERVDLVRAADRKVSHLSKGMQQRLGIAQSLVGDPAVIILDEPTSALDPAGRRMVRELIADLKQHDQTVLLSSHLLAEVEQTCDQIVILSNGRIAAEGTVDELVVASTVEITTDHGTTVHAVGRDEVHDIVAQKMLSGERIYEVARNTNRLEEAYLELVAVAEAGDVQ